MATMNMHMKFEIEIPKQTWLMLQKPCHLQTDGRMDGQTDGQGESRIPPSNFVGRGYKKEKNSLRMQWVDILFLLGNITGQIVEIQPWNMEAQRKVLAAILQMTFAKLLGSFGIHI